MRSFVSPSNRNFLRKKACGPFSFPIAMPIYVSLDILNVSVGDSSNPSLSVD